MNIILFGPQGCGKGTQADLIVKNYGLYHLSTGNELRSEIEKGTDIGKLAEGLINDGQLVPDDVVQNIILSRYHSQAAKGIIIDGYPRNAAQWGFLKSNFKIDAAIEITVPEQASIDRIANRRMCPQCKRNYNIVTIKPKVEGICDVDGTALIQRDDDKPAEIIKRLKIYKEQTEPLKAEYSNLNILHIVDGTKSIENVYKDIDKILANIR
jgi:adenylate kinase